MTPGARRRRNRCPNGQIAGAPARVAVQWNRAIMEVRHART
jgi:hypothetical protein